MSKKINKYKYMKLVGYKKIKSRITVAEVKSVGRLVE